MVATLNKAKLLAGEAAAKAEGDTSTALKDFESELFKACYHSTVKNTANEIHDILKVYYQVS